MHWKQIVRITSVLALLGQAGFAQTFVGIHCGSDEPFISPRGEIYEVDLPY